MECEHYPHVNSYTSLVSHALIDTKTPTQPFSANVYTHNHTITYEYFYKILLLRILLIRTLTLCNTFYSVTYIPIYIAINTSVHISLYNSVYYLLCI